MCAHQGGPACEGKICGQTEYEIVGPGKSIRPYESDKKFNLSCPWHGVEYDIRTGVCRSDGKMRLRSFKVTVKNGSVTVKV